MKPVVLQGHSRPIRDLKFNMLGDLLFTGSVDRLLSVWTTETGERIGTFSQTAAVSNLCVTKDSRYMVSGDTTGTIYLWDVYAGKKIREFEGDPSLSIKSINLCENEQKVSFVISGRQKNSKSYVETYRMVDLLSLSNTESLKKSVDLIIESSNYKFTSAKFSDFNKKLYVSKEDGSIDLFEINDNKPLMSTKLHNDSILDFDFSPKHDLIISASKDGKSKLIKSDNFEIINTFFPENPTRSLNACKISPMFSQEGNISNFDIMIAGGQDSKDVTTTHLNAGGFEVLFYNMLKKEEVGILSGHFGPVNALGFSGDGKFLASGGEDATIRLYRISDEFFQ